MDREKDISGASAQTTDEIKDPIHLEKNAPMEEDQTNTPVKASAGDASITGDKAPQQDQPEKRIPKPEEKPLNLSEGEEEAPKKQQQPEEDQKVTLSKGDKKGEQVAKEKASSETEKDTEPEASSKEVADVPATEKEQETTEGETQEKAAVAKDDTATAHSAAEKEVVKDSSSEDHADHHEEGDDHHEEDDEDKATDYGNFSKKELVGALEALLKESNIKKVERILKEIKPHYDELREEERTEALERFTAEGGDPADFAYKPDELDIKFEADYTLLRDRRAKHYASLERQKEDNLIAKNKLLERLRSIVDDEETTSSIDTLKEIQKEWKSIGQIPANQVKSLWANYNALMDRFYDNRSIYFELKELDRKKNLEAKLELCERAEKLQQVDNLKIATKELNELHEEFRHIGPVPKEEQEPLWQRFKAASDAIYDRRRVFVDKLKEELFANLKVKQQLGDEVQAYLQFDSDRINEWNDKTREILELQKRWEAVGGLPREKAKEVNKHFWGGFKGFFSNKNAFFKKLEGQREENLEKKKKLLEKAEALKDSQDWDTTAEELKRLQAEWREIGPVPEKQRNAVFASFKKACDHFFEQKRAKNKEVNKEYDLNLQKKEAICEAIEQLAKEKSNDVDKLETLFDQYQEIGFVPRNAIKSIQNRFNEAVEKFLEAADQLSEEDKHNIKLTIKFSKLKNSPNSNRKLYQKEGEIRKHIANLENDIALWRNNLEFFANSKTADKLKDDFNVKIKKAKGELKELKEQLHILRNI